MRDKVFYALFASAALGFTVLLWLIFVVAPEAQPAAGGIAQKIFYFHVPSAYGMYLAGAVCAVASAGYLLTESESKRWSWDALAQAGAEVAVVFGLMVLTSGPLWARKAWGVYWAWEPRLVTSLLSLLIYVAVVMVRAFAGGGHAERRFAAALGLLGSFNLPIIHFAVKKWGGVHPQVISSGGEGLKDPRMVTTLLVGFVAMTLFAALLLWVRQRQLKQSLRSRDLEERVAALADESEDPLPGPRPRPEPAE